MATLKSPWWCKLERTERDENGIHITFKVRWWAWPFLYFVAFIEIIREDDDDDDDGDPELAHGWSS